MNQSVKEQIIDSINNQKVKNPKDNFDLVINDLKKLSRIILCGFSCIHTPLIINGEIVQAPYLQRTTHLHCKNGNAYNYIWDEKNKIGCLNSVSLYNHEYCYECAKENTIEFKYHHQRCDDNIRRMFLKRF